jgi:DNA-binding response OmpR family regulator
MVFRVKALLRRSKIVNEKKLKVGDTILDYDALTIKINDNLYNMPPKEFYLIFKLLSSPNKIFTRIELMDEIWGMDTDIDDRTIDSHIKKLRRKFEDCSDFEIVTVRGLGYKSKINV